MATVIFAANNESYRRRRRAHRACEQCKRRRRRCEAPFENHDRCAGCTRDGIACSLAPPQNPNPSPHRRRHNPPTPPSDLPEPPSSRPRFVGDLNPESVFLTSSAAPVQRDLTECGVWASPPPPPPAPQSATTQQSPPDISRTYHAYLDSIGAFSLPLPRARDALVEIYFDSVNTLLPLVDEPSFRASYSKSTISIPLLHAILLVAARHHSAAPHLPHPVRAFAAQTAEKITALLNGGVEKDRVTLVRVYALLALHSEGPGGNETASLHLSTAIHHAYSLGLHLNRPTIPADEVRLWWCLWALDALQASLCGRPLGVRREDLSVPVPSQEGEVAGFVTLLKIADILTRVIALYRPGNTENVWKGDWPSCESLVPPTQNDGVAVTLRLFYYAVCILSHRSLPATTPPPASLTRRLESAQAIVKLGELHKCTLLPPLPVVPYAVSLALTTFFGEVREVGGGMPGFLGACGMLEELGGQWWFAGAMARMGRQAVERMQAKEAAGVLRVLSAGNTSGNAGGDERVRGSVSEREVQGGILSEGLGDGISAFPVGGWGWEGGEDVEAWFLYLFPDLAMPNGRLGDVAGGVTEGAWLGAGI